MGWNWIEIKVIYLFLCNIIYIFDTNNLNYFDMKTKIYFMFAAIMIFLSSSIIVCPPEGTEVTVYPDPEDCASYYECDNGILIHSTCPEGLVFNPVYETCDWDYEYGLWR